MSKPTILHMLTPAENLSPFDVNMAVDAGWHHCFSYTGISEGDVTALTQDAIFSRGPSGVKRTGLFLGGRDIHAAMNMLDAARKAMVPPFEVSVFADPSGAFTTAAAMIACAEKHYRKLTDDSLSGKTAVVFGGTGPVGMTAAMMAQQSGANALIVSHEGLDKAQRIADECNERYAVSIKGADGSSDSKIEALLNEADLAFNAAKAGVQVLKKEHLAAAQRVKVLCDVNAVPPEGIAGVGVMDDGSEVPGMSNGAVGIGALAVGNVKYQTQRALLVQMIETDKPVYLDFLAALETARAQA